MLAPTAHAQQRNVLLIIADEYGQDSSSLYNTNGSASLPPTPAIASLKTDGVLFRNAYAHPTCSPTRASILTGRHPFRHGVTMAVSSGTPVLQASEFTLPEAFAANASLGYSVAQFGKWHLANEVNSPVTLGGWPHFSGFLIGTPQNYSSWTKTVNGTSTTGYTVYNTTDVVDDAIAWIQARGTQPWFVWLAFAAGHAPLHKPPNDLHSYDSLSGTTAHINNNPRPYFEAMIEAMDTEMARLLAAVDRSKTDIIFLGDNGTTGNVIQPPFSSSQGKSTLYEGGTRVPLIIAGPDVVSPNRESSALVKVEDLFSTILELAGIQVAGTVSGAIPLDSNSLVPIIKNQADTAVRYSYAEIGGDTSPNVVPGRMVRSGDFKLIRLNTGVEEFYDVAGDPAEQANLLAGSMSPTQQANYYSLVLKLAELQDDLPEPVMTGATASGGQYSISVQTVANTTYTLWRSADLTSLSWAPVTNAVISSSGGTTTLTDPDASSGSRFFYRVMATPQ